MSEGLRLHELIQERKGRLSFQDLVDRSPDGKPGYSRWQQLATNVPPMQRAPEPDLCLAIADALRVPIAVVWDAIGRSVGLPLARPSSQLVDWMPQGTEHLNPAAVDAIHTLVRELVGAEQRVVEEMRAAPVRPLRAAQKATGTQDKGARGSARAKKEV